ncbi:MAG: YhdP family protein [Thioalkalivibrio sp.]
MLWERKPHGWQLRIDEARIQEGAAQGLSMNYRDEDGERQVWGELDGVRLERLGTVVLAQGRLLQAEHRQWLERLAPVGEIAQASFNLRLGDEGEPLRARVQGEFRDLGMSPHEKIPGFQGLDGAFSLDDQGGEVSLASDGLRFDAPRLFADSLWLDALGGRVHFERTEEAYRVSGEDLRLHNADGRAWGRMQLDLGPQPSMDLALEFSDGNGSQTATYLPVGIMPSNLTRWLSESIVDGRVRVGRVVFRGPLVKLPFKDGEGVFRVEAQVEEGVLDYRPGWPAISDLEGTLIFTDRGMRAESASGRIFDARISEATVSIEDFKAAVLEIDGRVDGALADMLRYVRQSPLVSGLDPLLDETRAEGDSRLDLSLHIPLGRRTGGPGATRAEGSVTLADNRLSLAGQPVDFQSVQGQVRFTEATVDASGLSARLNDEALTLDASLPRGGALTVNAQGMQPVSAFESVLPEYLRGQLTGRSLWQARLRSPMGGRGATTLRLQSRLEGVTSRLPAPFNKPAARAVPLTVEVPLTARNVTPLQFSYGQILSVLLRPASPGRPARGELRLNDGQAQMPERGVRVAGRLDELVLDDWMGLEQSVRSSDVHGPAEQLVDAVDLHIGRLRSGERLIPDVHIEASRSAQRWEAHVLSTVLSGRLDIPHDLAGAAPMTLNLDLLDLDALAASAQGETALGDAGRAGPRLDPRELPGIRATVASLVLDGRSFRNLRMEATGIREGLQIHHLQLGSARGYAQLRMNGDWRVSASGRHQTQLRFDINSGDVGAALTDLGFEHGFDRGSARLDGQLRWPDAVTHFTWEGLQGNARVDLKDGRLKEVEPGAGRLLGLFSLNMIPRRLALDFRDLFQRGLSFDTLTGNIRLVDGDAYTSDLAIASSAAHINIEGRTGIVARDYDQKVVVTPRVGSALPVAGLILGGPVGGVAVFVMDKILGMGKRIDEAARVEYLITGPWAQPHVEVVAQPVDEAP